MDMDIQSYLIGHLDIVAGIFDALNIDRVKGDKVLERHLNSKNLCESLPKQSMFRI
jgi:hypothetical protein